MVAEQSNRGNFTSQALLFKALAFLFPFRGNYRTLLTLLAYDSVAIAAKDKKPTNEATK